jgi:hypothetical protein
MSSCWPRSRRFIKHPRKRTVCPTFTTTLVPRVQGNWKRFNVIGPSPEKSVVPIRKIARDGVIPVECSIAVHVIQSVSVSFSPMKTRGLSEYFHARFVPFTTPKFGI